MFMKSTPISNLVTVCTIYSFNKFRSYLRQWKKVMMLSEETVSIENDHYRAMIIKSSTGDGTRMTFMGY